jgi:hypothetical protein
VDPVLISMRLNPVGEGGWRSGTGSVGSILINIIKDLFNIY